MMSSPFLIEPIRRMSRRTERELQGVTACGASGRTEHHADLHADLVDEDDQQLVSDGGSEFACRVCSSDGPAKPGRASPISPRSSALGVGGHRVHDDQVDRNRRRTRVSTISRVCCSPGIRLRNQGLAGFAPALSVLNVQSVFGVDESRHRLVFAFRHHLQGQGWFLPDDSGP